MKTKFVNSAEVVQALKNKGYQVEVREVNKNGVAKIGYVFLDGEQNAKPTLYIGEDAPTEPEAIADYLIDIYKDADSISLDVNSLIDWNRAKENLVLSVCGIGKEQAPCKTLSNLGLDVYARLEVFDNLGYGSSKVTEDLLKAWDKSLDEVLEVATENLKKNVVAQDIVTALIEMSGHRFEEFEPDFEALNSAFAPMFVISNSKRFFGAGQIFNAEVLERVAERFDSDLYILPSSIHEIIVVPTVLGSLDDLLAMVELINSTEVKPEDFFSNSVYEFERKEKRLTLAK